MHQDAHYAVVDFVNHRVEERCALKLEDDKRIFLLVAGVLYRLFQLVKVAEVFFPFVIDNLQQYGLLKLLYE